MNDRRRAQAHEAHSGVDSLTGGPREGPSGSCGSARRCSATPPRRSCPRRARRWSRNLHRIRGPAPLATDTRDVLATFGNYASCLAEVLSNDAEGGPRAPETTIHHEEYEHNAMKLHRGIIMVSAHTAGWESVGPVLARDQGLRMMIVMQAEPDERAQSLQDEARRRAGVTIVHAGDDPLAALPLLRHLRSPGGVVALQLDRFANGMRTREVDFLGRRTAIPEGPLRLAQVSGAPIVPVFCARVGFRRVHRRFSTSRAPCRVTPARPSSTPSPSTSQPPWAPS